MMEAYYECVPTMRGKRSDRRLWRSHFNGLLYIPAQGRYLLSSLESKGPVEFLAELDRLSNLGSPWASAMLGYIALMPGSNGKRDTARAMELCKKHAYAGDSYAQFVWAWALIYAGDHNLGLQSMEKAVFARFPPATIDLAKFAWNGWGMKERYPAVALKALQVASEVGHKGALYRRCLFYKTGEFGFMWRILAYVVMPFAAAKYVLAACVDPFSCQVFTFRTSATVPLLRTQPRRI